MGAAMRLSDDDFGDFDFSSRDTTITSAGPHGEVEVTYDAGDPETLAAIRSYQLKLRSVAPDWLTQFTFDPAANRYHLFVFPVASAPWFFLNHRHGY